MADEQYDVGARVTLDTKGAEASSRRLASTLSQIGSTIRANQSLLSGMTAKLVGAASVYFGFNALTNAITRAGRAMYTLEAETTQTRIGLASVFSAVENISFAQAGALAGDVYAKLTDDAIESVATTKELFEIYAGIVGPIRSAGFELDKVRTITKDVVNASSALGVDFPQAKRDVAAMVRGAAGMDVKLFQTLRSMNLIKEDAKEFNKLTQASRVEKIAEALKRAGVGGAAFGRSLPGRVSTFIDIVQQFSRAFAGPLFDSFADKLGKVNEYLLKNRSAITAYLARVGTEMSLRFETAFGRAAQGAKWVSTHWDEIVRKAGEVVARMEVLAPQLAKAYLGLSIGREVLGRGFELSGIAANMGLGFGGAAASTAAAALGPAAAAKTAARFAAPHEVGAMSAMMAANRMPEYVPRVIGLGGTGAGAGGAAGAAAGLGGATTALVVLGSAVAALGSIVMAANDQWVFAKQTLQETLKPAESLWGHVAQIGKNMWDMVQPFMRLGGGTLFVVLNAGLTVLATVLDGLAWGVEKITSVFAFMGNELDKLVDFGLQQVLVKINDRMRAINEFLFGPKKAGPLEYSGDNRMDTRRGMFGGSQITDQMPSERGVKVPKQRPMIVNDFRGSTFHVKNDFKSQDPDRIMRVFVRGLEKQAERRIQSGYAPAFSR